MTLDLPGSGRIRLGTPPSESSATIPFASLLQPLYTRVGGAAGAELRSLAGEPDPELFFEGLISFGARQEQLGDPALAAEVYGLILGTDHSGLGVTPTLRGRAQARLDAILGRGAFGARFEFLGRHFAREAADPVNLLAMTSGSLVFSLARGAFLSRLLAAPTRNLLTTGFGARALASAGAFALEVPAFWATGKGLREVLAPGSQSWDPATNFRELAGAGLTLGALKLTGYAAQGLFRRAHGLSFEAGAGLPAGLRLAQQAYAQAGMFTGILLGHRLEEWTGLRRPVDGATTLVDSLVMLLQFNVGGRLSGSLLGEGWSRRIQELDSRLAGLEPGGPRPSHPAPRSLGPALALAGGPLGPEPAGRRAPELLASRPLLMAMTGEGGGLQKSAGGWRGLLQEVVERGRDREIQDLRDRLQGALTNGKGNGIGLRLTEKFLSRDPQEWRSAIRILSELLERDPRLVERLDGSAELQEFGSEWRARPHFRSADQVPTVIAEGTPKVYRIQNMLYDLRKAIAEQPNLRGWEGFASPRRARGDISRSAVVAEPEGGKRIFANWKILGLEIAFDARGYFRGRIEVRSPFAETEWSELGRPKPALVAPKPPALRHSEMGPRRGENPSLWAMRLLEASRGSEENSLEIARVLAERLENPETAPATREMIERLLSITSILPEGQSILVRRYSIPDVRDPLTIVSLPTTFLPEQWSRVFAEGIVQDFRQHRGPVNRAVEIGSGTGWVSILMAKLGMAREVIGLDRNPHAPIVGRLNAALNGARGVSFQTGDLLSNLPEGLQADLIVACLPQVPRNGGIDNLRAVADYYSSEGTYWDRFGLGLIDRALGQARGRLAEGGRVLFNLGGRPGRPALEALLEARGFHPAIRYGQLIQQDPTTDFSELARLEAQNRHRFEFFLKEDPTRPISAAEAVGRGEVHHMLYLTEGRPYSDLLNQALVATTRGPRHWGYTADPGTESEELRLALAPELSRQWGVRVSPDMIFLGPSSDLLLDGLLRVLLPERGRVSYAGPSGEEAPMGLRHFTPSWFALDWAALRDRVAAGSAEALVLRLPREGLEGEGGLAALLQTAANRKSHVVILEDHPLRLQGGAHPVAEFLANHPEAVPYLHVVQSLDRRYGAAELPLAAALIGNSAVQGWLRRYGDLTYSRGSTLTQEAYRHFFQHLPRGLLSEAEPSASVEPMLTAFEVDSPLHRALASPAAFESGPSGTHPDPIDMSFGESEWSAPVDLGPVLREAPRRPAGELYAEAQRAVAEYLRDSRGASFSPEQIILGAGVQPLLVSAIRGLGRVEAGKSVQVALPRPSYGLFFPTIEAAGARRVDVLTPERDRFLPTGAQVALALSRNTQMARWVHALLINEPNNPVGQYYGVAPLRALSQVLRAMNGYLLFDDVFGMLDFGRIRGRRTPSLQVLEREMGPRLIAFGGLSKEFAAGGLRFGFAATTHAKLAEAVREDLLAGPDPLALAAAPAYLSRWSEFLPAHRHYLSSRAFALETVLRERNIPFVPAQGGYALFADLSPLYGRRLRLRSGAQAEITSQNLQDLLYTEAGIKLHSEAWAGIPGHYRFVFSIDRLEEATQRLKLFFRSAR
ncbi:MAG: aminotransferase class I/II-fold pyridoxal phosphate-dependent enzyme [bacterium]